MRIKTALFALISIFLPLFLIEGGVRLVASDYIEGRTNFADWLEDMADELIARTTIDGRDVYYSEYLPSRYYRDAPKIDGNMVDAVKGPKTFRILSVGGSTVAGAPFGHWASFSRFLNDGLAEIARPDAKVEVMNLGLSSGSSTAARLLLGQFDMLVPDLIIVYAGDNEICDANAAMEAAGVSSGGRYEFLERIARPVARHSYTYRLLDIAVNEKPKEKLFRKYPCHSETRPLTRRQDLDILTDRYRENIAAIVGLAKAMGADVLLVGSVMNMVAPPSELSGNAEPEIQLALDGMAEAFVARDADAYANTRKMLLALDPESPMPLYYDGLWAFRDGRNGEAHDLLEAALSVDRLPTRARPIYDQVLAAIAAADSAVGYLDMMDFARELVPDGILDGRLFLDATHPTVELNRLIADKIIRNHFSVDGIRPDLFAYAGYDGSTVYRPVPEEERYGSICRRYFRGPDWRECIETGLQIVSDAKDSGNFSLYRGALNVWEHLFYYGRANDDAAALAQSRELFQPRTPGKPSS